MGFPSWVTPVHMVCAARDASADGGPLPLGRSLTPMGGGPIRPPSSPRTHVGIGYLVASVLVHPALLTEPHRAAREVAQVRGQQATAANGAAMRTAVAGVPFFWDKAVVRRNTLDICAVTHADARCKASCLLITSAVARMLQGELLSPELFDRVCNEDLLEPPSGTDTDTGTGTGAGVGGDSPPPALDDEPRPVRRLAMTLPRSRYGLGFALRLHPDGLRYAVSSVEPGGSAERRGLRVGDVVAT